MKRFFAIILLSVMTLASCAVDNIAVSEPQSVVTSDAVSAIDFESAFTDESGLEKTDPPEIIEYRVVDRGRAVFAGSCETGATIYAEHDGKLIVDTKSADGRFFFEVNPERKGWDINIYAKTDNKNLSEPLKAQANYSVSEKSEFSDYVWVGDDFWLFFTNTRDQFMKTVLYSGREISALTAKTKQKVDWLKENCGGAELIYVLAPNPNTIYPEFMPNGLTRPGGITLREQTAAALSAGGATVIDMTETLTAHKNDPFFIYHNTDSHWTEYGAFFAYTALMDKISEKFPSATPRPISNFGFTNEFRYLGDLYYDLGTDNKKLKENTTFAHPIFPTPYKSAKYRDGEIRIEDDPTEQQELQNAYGEGKPDVLIMRDSYSVMLFDYIAERCDRTFMYRMWEFGFNTEEISAFNPDYVIYIISEMNLINIAK